MSWEELSSRVYKSRTTWGMSCNEKAYAVWFPRGHSMSKGKKVRILVGKKEDEGWIRMFVSPEGRSINLSKNGTAHVRFSTLPGAPNVKMGMVDLQIRNVSDGSVEFLLPWAKRPYTSVFSKDISRVA